MSTWGLPFTCPACGGECSAVSIGAPVGGRETNSVVRCSKSHEWLIRVSVVAVAAKADCGSDSGYQKHRAAGTEPCRECRMAHAWTNRGHRAYGQKSNGRQDRAGLNGADLVGTEGG